MRVRDVLFAVVVLLAGAADGRGQPCLAVAPARPEVDQRTRMSLVVANRLPVRLFIQPEGAPLSQPRLWRVIEPDQSVDFTFTAPGSHTLSVAALGPPWPAPVGSTSVICSQTLQVSPPVSVAEFGDVRTSFGVGYLFLLQVEGVVTQFVGRHGLGTSIGSAVSFRDATRLYVDAGYRYRTNRGYWAAGATWWDVRRRPTRRHGGFVELGLELPPFRQRPVWLVGRLRVLGHSEEATSQDRQVWVGARIDLFDTSGATRR